jgi:hypothetical protein
MNQWQKFVAIVREWDRREHNWHEEQRRNGTVSPKPGRAKTDFIHLLMKEYKLEKRYRK